MGVGTAGGRRRRCVAGVGGGAVSCHRPTGWLLAPRDRTLPL